jgi:hypothetical protein
VSIRPDSAAHDRHHPIASIIFRLTSLQKCGCRARLKVKLPRKSIALGVSLAPTLNVTEAYRRTLDATRAIERSGKSSPAWLPGLESAINGTTLIRPGFRPSGVGGPAKAGAIKWHRDPPKALIADTREVADFMPTSRVTATLDTQLCKPVSVRYRTGLGRAETEIGKW